MPDPVPCIHVFVITQILPPGDPCQGKSGLDFLPGNTQQRTDPFSIHRSDAAQSSESGSSGQIQKYGFRIVIAVVGGRNPGPPFFPAHCLKSLSAHCTPGFLSRLFPFSGN